MPEHEARLVHDLPDGRHVYTKMEVQAIADSPHVLVLRDRDTVDSLAQRLQHARRIAVVGNGGIAMELVFNLRGTEVRSFPFYRAAPKLSFTLCTVSLICYLRIWLAYSTDKAL